LALASKTGFSPVIFRIVTATIPDAPIRRATAANKIHWLHPQAHCSLFAAKIGKINIPFRSYATNGKSAKHSY
jgi:hypothetical protein